MRGWVRLCGASPPLNDSAHVHAPGPPVMYALTHGSSPLQAVPLRMHACAQAWAATSSWSTFTTHACILLMRPPTCARAGVGGTIHLVNNYGDNLTFRPQPFVWHFFLSHIQRESSDMCGLLISCLHDRSTSGRHARAWYDNKAAAIVSKEAMELGVVHSKVFVLVLSPSILKSPYVKFEVLVGAMRAPGAGSLERAGR